MAQRGKKKVALVSWQARFVRGAIRLAERFGQYPSAPELAREFRCSRKWANEVLWSMRDDGLMVLAGHGASAGWQPTGEALRWCELGPARLDRSDAPPRMIRVAGVGAVRAWKSRETTKRRLAVSEVYDVEPLVSSEETFE